VYARREKENALYKGVVTGSKDPPSATLGEGERMRHPGTRVAEGKGEGTLDSGQVKGAARQLNENTPRPCVAKLRREKNKTIQKGRQSVAHFAQQKTAEKDPKFGETWVHERYERKNQFRLRLHTTNGGAQIS